MSNDSSKPRLTPLSAISVTLLAYFGSQLLAGIFVGLIALAAYKDISKVEAAFAGHAGWQFATITFVGVSSLYILWQFMKWRGITWAHLGLERKPKISDAGYAVIFFAIYAVVAILVLGLVDELIPNIDTDQKQILGFDSVTGPLALSMVFVSLVLIPSVVEEIMIRGFLYSGLRTKLTKIVSALVASAIFGLAHLQIGSGAPPLWVVAIDTFVLSLILIALRERTGSLWAGMFVHATKNSLAFTYLFVLHGA